LLSLLEVTFGRDLIGPLEHPVMTALLSAALFAASRGGRFRITGTVLLVYLGVAAAHGLIDTAPDLLALVLRNQLLATSLGALAGILVALGLSIIWFVYARRLGRRMLDPEARSPAQPAPPDTAVPFAGPPA
jgi:hypothetical protein